MKPVLTFIILAACIISVIIMAIITHLPSWSYFIPSGISIIALISLLRGIIIPAKTVTHGMELIKSQDYNNRLVKVGEPNADRIVSLFNSLIDKLRSERLLNREQENLLKMLIDASPMGIVMLDFNHNISLVNSSFMQICGIKQSEEIKGKALSSLKFNLLADMLNVPLGKSEIIRKGNFQIYRCYHLSFIQEGFKREFYLLESLKDEIIKAERDAYGKVIRTISHEVNNTMGGVRSVLEIIHDVIEDSEIKNVIESCDNRCEKMCQFIGAYADVVKIPDPVAVKFDLINEIELQVPFLRQMLPENVELSFTHEDIPVMITADAGQIQQVIINIVKNASESILKNGYINIHVRENKEGVWLIISNNGAPINNEVSRQLFSPFFTTKTDGKGIGLTIVQEILNRHKADYHLFTDSDNITRFSILFH